MPGTAIILNPNAGSADQAQTLARQLRRRKTVRLLTTQGEGHAAECVAEALSAGYRTIVAAGGDGTINEVLNGLEGAFEHVTLGIIPLGTGNDLARTLALPLEPLEALALLRRGKSRRLDLIRASAAGNSCYALNVAAGGFSGQVDELLTPELKASWGPLAYIISAASVLPNLTGYETSIAWDGQPAAQIEALNVIVANCRTAAGGFNVAPLANPEDGLLDLVVVLKGSLLDLAGVAARLLVGNYINSDQVLHRRVRQVSIRSHPGMWFNLDGELRTNEPISFRVIPGALRVIVGPGYQPEGQAAQ